MLVEHKFIKNCDYSKTQTVAICFRVHDCFTELALYLRIFTQFIHIKTWYQKIKNILEENNTSLLFIQMSIKLWHQQAIWHCHFVFTKVFGIHQHDTFLPCILTCILWGSPVIYYAQILPTSNEPSVESVWEHWKIQKYPNAKCQAKNTR